MTEVDIDRTQGGDGTGTRARVRRRGMRRPRDGTGARRLGSRPLDRRTTRGAAVGLRARLVRRASAGATGAIGPAPGTESAAGPACYADVTGDADDPRTTCYADVTGNADDPRTTCYADVTGNADDPRTTCCADITGDTDGAASRGPVPAASGRPLAVRAATGRAAADGPSAASG